MDGTKQIRRGVVILFEKHHERGWGSSNFLCSTDFFRRNKWNTFHQHQEQHRVCLSEDFERRTALTGKLSGSDSLGPLLKYTLSLRAIALHSACISTSSNFRYERAISGLGAAAFFQSNGRSPFSYHSALQWKIHRLSVTPVCQEREERQQVR